MTLPDLLNADDLTSFQQSDQDWFLAAAGETIRNHCQWHIAPNITVVEDILVQPDGTIMLPSLYVTDVLSVSVNDVELDPNTFQWRQAGYITRQPQQFQSWPLWPLSSDQPFREYPSPLSQKVTIEYSHGYDALPAQVAAVGFELTNRAMEMPSGVASRITSGPYGIDLVELGIVLTPNQKHRLGPFTLVRF